MVVARLPPGGRRNACQCEGRMTRYPASAVLSSDGLQFVPDSLLEEAGFEPLVPPSGSLGSTSPQRQYARAIGYVRTATGLDPVSPALLIDIVLLGIRLLRVQPDYDAEDPARRCCPWRSSRQICGAEIGLDIVRPHRSPLNSRGRSITRCTMLQVDLSKEAGGRPLG
jgi:hypothetical protein